MFTKKVEEQIERDLESGNELQLICYHSPDAYVVKRQFPKATVKNRKREVPYIEPFSKDAPSI